jgi:uncharacterized OB-fold protein
VKEANRTWSHARIKGRLPPQLARCPGCGEYVYPEAKTCPHCKGKIATLVKRQRAAIAKAERAIARLQKALGQ